MWFLVIVKFIYKIYATILLTVLLICTILISYPLSLFRDKGQKVLWYVFHYFIRIWFFLVRIRIRIEHHKKENILDKKSKYIFIANHSSYIDTQLYYGYFPFTFKILGAKEYSKIPFFGFFFKQLAILVNRKVPKSRNNSILKLKKTLSKNWNILIPPEGKITSRNQSLTSFYNGAFRLAIETNTPILPIVFPDVLKRTPNGSFWNLNPGLCRVIHLPIMEPDKEESVESFKQRVFQAMTFALNKANS